MSAIVQVVADATPPTVVVHGDLDLASAPTVRSTLRQGIRTLASGRNGGIASRDAAPAPRLRLDLTDVGAIDDVGVGVLLGAVRVAADIGSELTVVAGPTVRAGLERHGVVAAVPLVDAEE